MVPSDAFLSWHALGTDDLSRPLLVKLTEDELLCPVLSHVLPKLDAVATMLPDHTILLIYIANMRDHDQVKWLEAVAQSVAVSGKQELAATKFASLSHREMFPVVRRWAQVAFARHHTVDSDMAAAHRPSRYYLDAQYLR